MKICVIVSALVTVACCHLLVACLGSPTPQLSQPFPVYNRLNHVGHTKPSRHSRQVDGSAPLPMEWLSIHLSPPPEVQVRVHDSIIMECEFAGAPPPTVYWLREGQVIQEGSSVEEIEEETNSLERTLPLDTVSGMSSVKSRLYLDCMTQEDEGEYMCVGQSAVERKGSSTMLTVSGRTDLRTYSICTALKNFKGSPARVLLWLPTLIYPQGQEVRLICNAEGTPTPTITWSMGGKRLLDSSKYQVTKSGNLVIRKLEWMDMGVYECTAENKFGSDTVATFLYPLANEK